MPVSLERTGLTFDAHDRVKLIRGVRPIFEGTKDGAVYVSVGAADDAQGDVTWSDPIPFTIGSTLQADAFAAGRFMAIKIESDEFVSWRMKRMDVDVQVMGRY
jgi:hypothetical protein